MSKYLGPMDSNMNTLQYVGGGGPAGSGSTMGCHLQGNVSSGGSGGSYYNHPSRMPPGGSDAGMKKTAMVTNSMCYREQTRPKSPHQFPQPAPMNTILDDFGHRPGSPPGGASGYDDDRIHNDLLEEICSDIGIRDTMDLDFLDFDGTETQYFGTKLPAEEGDSFGNQPLAFGQFSNHMEEYSKKGEKLSVAVSHGTGLHGKGTKDSIASPTVSSTSLGSQECPRPNSIGSLGSPSVHSTTSQSQINHPQQTQQGPPSSPTCDEEMMKNLESSSRANSFDSLVDSPATVIAMRDRAKTPDILGLDSGAPVGFNTQDVPNINANKLKNLKEYGSIYGRAPTTQGCVVPQSPMKSVKAEESVHKQAFDQAKVPRSQFKPVQSPSVGTTVSTAGVSNSLSASASQAPFTPGNIFPNIKQEDQTFQRPASVDGKNKDMSVSSRSIDSPFDLGYASMGSASVCTESHYGSMTSLDKMSTFSSSDMEFKEKVMNYLHHSVPSNVPNFIPRVPISQSQSAHIPGTSSLPDSPPQERVAKRARRINCGTDLLDCMREQFAFVKGADMYAKPRYPHVPVQRTRPTPYMQPSRGLLQSQQSCAMSGDAIGNIQPNFQLCQQQSHTISFSGSRQDGMGMPRADSMSPNPLSSAPITTKAMQQITGPNMQMTAAPQPMNMRPNVGMPQNNPYARTNGYGPGSSEDGFNMGVMPNCGGNPGYDSRPPVGRPRMVVQEMSPMANRPTGMQYDTGQMPEQGNNVSYGCAQQSQYHFNSSNQLRHKVAGLSGQSQNWNGNGQWQQQAENSSCSMSGAISQPPGNAMGGMRPPQNGMGPMDPGMSVSQGVDPMQDQQHQQDMNIMGNNPGMMPSHGPNHRTPYTMGPQSPYNQQAMNMQQQNMNRPMGGSHMTQQPSMGRPGQINNVNMQIQHQGPVACSVVGAVAGDPQMVPNHMNSTAMGPTGVGMPPGNQPMTPQEGLMHHIISDKSNSFRSHPLFPLLRDLIIADMNFHSPSFPFQLIANLPADFDKLLQNYMNRNPNTGGYQGNDAVNGVLMDALKYAHRAIIEKIKVKKQQEGYKEPPRPLSAIEDFCERFDKAVRNNLDSPNKCGKSDDPQSASSLMASKSLSASMPLHPLKPSSPALDNQSFDCRPPGNGSSSLPCTPSKSHKSTSESTKSGGNEGSSKGGTQNGGGGKNKVLPKEAVAVMLSWLREHQDNPYPNDDEKEMLIAKTKLTINQINYWFTNARRRILPKWALQRYMEQQQQQHQYATQMHMLGAHH